MLLEIEIRILYFDFLVKIPFNNEPNCKIFSLPEFSTQIIILCGSLFFSILILEET